MRGGIGRSDIVKAILVLEMPSACKDCPLRVSIDESICVKTLKDITDKEYFEQTRNFLLCSCVQPRFSVK